MRKYKILFTFKTNNIKKNKTINHETDKLSEYDTLKLELDEIKNISVKGKNYRIK